tara:strand:+ start:246 stop:1061 length:816 start_codon:yes stop_codon:yes gene_type:complete
MINMTPEQRAQIIDPDIEEKIHKTLDEIEREHEVKILHAVESGSRAWGFHSPNSDYDVRFVYVHKRDWYLSIYAGRDVIELPINEIYDVSGWDLKKTLHLAMKSNAVVLEWLHSPIIYRSNPEFVSGLQEFCRAAFDQRALIHHYINLGSRQLDQTWRTKNKTQIKKYFYMIRPAMALRWLGENDNGADVPMDIWNLMDGANVSQDIQDKLNELIERKKSLVEKEEISKIDLLDNFMISEFTKAKARLENLPKGRERSSKKADEFFRNWLD